MILTEVFSTGLLGDLTFWSYQCYQKLISHFKYEPKYPLTFVRIVARGQIRSHLTDVSILKSYNSS